MSVPYFLREDSHPPQAVSTEKELSDLPPSTLQFQCHFLWSNKYLQSHFHCIYDQHKLPNNKIQIRGLTGAGIGAHPPIWSLLNDPKKSDWSNRAGPNPPATRGYCHGEEVWSLAQWPTVVWITKGTLWDLLQRPEKAASSLGPPRTRWDCEGLWGLEGHSCLPLCIRPTLSLPGPGVGQFLPSAFWSPFVQVLISGFLRVFSKVGDSKNILTPLGKVDNRGAGYSSHT